MQSMQLQRPVWMTRGFVFVALVVCGTMLFVNIGFTVEGLRSMMLSLGVPNPDIVDTACYVSAIAMTTSCALCFGMITHPVGLPWIFHQVLEIQKVTGGGTVAKVTTWGVAIFSITVLVSFLIMSYIIDFKTTQIALGFDKLDITDPAQFIPLTFVIGPEVMAILANGASILLKATEPTPVNNYASHHSYQDNRGGAGGPSTWVN